jgi:uncharacterized protein
LDEPLTRRRIPVPKRLRRAVLQHDLLLVQRVINNHPEYIRNPDWEDYSNTTLHMAAKEGCLDIVVCILAARDD